MLILSQRHWAITASGLAAIVSIDCAPNNVETVASPVEAVTRSTETLRGQFGDAYVRRGDDGTVVARVLAPAPGVWDAVRVVMAARQVTPTIFDRPAGRMGDTSLMLMRRFNGKPLSTYFSCGSTMTGSRADEDRIRTIFLVQLSRMKEDTIAIAVHFSGEASRLASGSSSSVAPCTSTGRAESEFLDDVLRRLGTDGRRG